MTDTQNTVLHYHQAILLDNGFAATMQLTHTRGNGYIDGTDFQAYSYFISANYNISQKQGLEAFLQP